MMKVFGSSLWVARGAPVALVLALAGTAVPAFAQDATVEARLRRIEAEVRALQRQVFPGGSPKFFAPEVAPAPGAAPAPGTPATTAVTDLLTRMEAVEGQLARLTAQSEETANRLKLLETRLGPVASTDPAVASAVPVAAAAVAPAAPPSPTAAPASAMAVTAPPKPAPVVAAAAVKPAAAKPAVAAKPSAARVAAVQAIVKPQTQDPGDDEYSYGFRLWEAKFYPEAQQQLRLFVDTYPRHARVSFGRNLLGRAFLDDGKPREAAPWFLQNFQADKNGARAADSLLYLAESMVKLKDTNRACIALAEFTETYPVDAAGRLKGQFDTTRASVKCK